MGTVDGQRTHTCTLRLKLRPPNLKPSSDFHLPIVVARSRPNSYTAQHQVVATKHMDTVAFTFRESSENQVQYLDEAKGEPVKYTGEKLDSASLDEWVNGLLLKSEPGQALTNKIFSRFAQGIFERRTNPTPFFGIFWVHARTSHQEPIPEGHPLYLDGSLVVVGKTFEEVVSKTDQDVFMLLDVEDLHRCIANVFFEFKSIH